MADQVDLFLDTLVNAPIRSERSGMEFPFFCLTKKPRMDPLEYRDGRVSITIEPGPRGMATIWDKDIIIYCASLINERLERGMSVDRTVTVSAYDVLRVCERGTGKASYELLLDALARLRSTTIYTSITAADERERRGFGWLDNFRVIERTDKRGKKMMAAIEITLNDWLLRAIVKERRVLAINRAYFRLTMGIERRIYEIARKHCGRQPNWKIKLGRLAEKCGTERDTRKFKADIKKIIDRDSLPDYRMSLAFDPANRKEIELAFDGRGAARWSKQEDIIVVFEPRNPADLPDD